MKDTEGFSLALIEAYEPNTIISKIEQLPELFEPLTEHQKRQIRNLRGQHLSEYVFTRLVKLQDRAKVSYDKTRLDTKQVSRILKALQSRDAATSQKVAAHLENFNQWLAAPYIIEVQNRDHNQRRKWRNALRDKFDTQNQMQDYVGPFTDFYEKNKIRGNNIAGYILLPMSMIPKHLKDLGIPAEELKSHQKRIKEGIEIVQKETNSTKRQRKEAALIKGITTEIKLFVNHLEQLLK